MGGRMCTAIRVTALIAVAGYFGLMPAVTDSFVVDPKTHLSNWHPSDEVPCLIWLYTKDLATGVEGCQCVDMLEAPDLFDELIAS